MGLLCYALNFVSELVTLCAKAGVCKAWTHDCDKQQPPWPWCFSDLGVAWKQLLWLVWGQRSPSHSTGSLPTSDTAFASHTTILCLSFSLGGEDTSFPLNVRVGDAVQMQNYISLYSLDYPVSFLSLIPVYSFVNLHSLQLVHFFVYVHSMILLFNDV